jgi:hypothetical protein
MLRKATIATTTTDNESLTLILDNISHAYTTQAGVCHVVLVTGYDFAITDTQAELVAKLEAAANPTA